MGRAAVILARFLGVLLPVLAEELLARAAGGDLADRLRARGPERLRRALQELGGAFVKFGQLLSMRVDLLPERYCDALAKLFDQVPPFPGQEARRIVEAELLAPVEELFSTFEDEPLAAASMGQVHRAILARGADAGAAVVVKVQRPAIAETIERDGRWLVRLARLVDASGALGQIRLAPAFRDFLRYTLRETNFTQEAKNADRLYEETEWNTKQRIPYVYWSFTTPRVLTMEFLEGLPVSDVLRRLDAGDETVDDDLAAMGCDRLSLARHLMQNHHLQSLVGEVFHADPHPGNVIVMPDNVIGYVDFGLLGRMKPEGRRENLALLAAVAQKDVERLFVSILDLLDAPRGLLVTDYFDEFQEAADEWLDYSDNPGATLSEKSIANLVLAVMGLARRIGLPLTISNTLFFRASMSIDASVLRLAPRIDYHRETVQSLRLVKLREIEQRMAPGSAIDSTLQAYLLLLSAPDFISDQLIKYQQATTMMYRKINQVPLVLAGVARASAWGAVALGLGLSWVQFFDLPESVVFLDPPLFVVVEALGPAYPLPFLLALGLFWVGRVLDQQSVQKVQREE